MKNLWIAGTRRRTTSARRRALPDRCGRQLRAGRQRDQGHRAAIEVPARQRQEQACKFNVVRLSPEKVLGQGARPDAGADPPTAPTATASRCPPAAGSRRPRSRATRIPTGSRSSTSSCRRTSWWTRPSPSRTPGTGNRRQPLLHVPPVGVPRRRAGDRHPRRRPARPPSLQRGRVYDPGPQRASAAPTTPADHSAVRRGQSTTCSASWSWGRSNRTLRHEGGPGPVRRVLPHAAEVA